MAKHPHPLSPYIAFEGFRCVGSGDLIPVAIKVKKIVDQGEKAPVLIFDNATGELVEIDYRGTSAALLKRLRKFATISRGESPDPPPAPDSFPRRGRPKLGVIAREVTLLPRHWEWLNRQTGGASVTLRKLVEEALRANEGPDRIRQACEVTYKFMTTLMGNYRDFEEASRALFRADKKKLTTVIDSWPKDARDHIHRLAEPVFEKENLAGS